MDCAKAIAFLAVNDGDVSDYIFGKKSGDKALPLILIPTTCGTGSEGNGLQFLPILIMVISRSHLDVRNCCKGINCRP